MGLVFAKAQEFVLQTLSVPDIDPGLWQLPEPAGFRASKVAVR
jgi:hypothetical protein